MDKGDMKKTNRNVFISKFSSRYKQIPSIVGTGAMSVEFVPSKTRIRKKYAPKPRLEKIGGMENKVRDFISQHCNLALSTTSIIRTSVTTSVLQLPKNVDTIINLKR